MNAYTYTIRHSTVVFTFTIYASSKRSAKRQAIKKIKTSYPNFHIYRLNTVIY